MPVYCETSLNALGGFPAEPINTVTSLVPVVLGVFALVYLVRRRQHSYVAYALASLTILTGLGSIAWHALRTELTLLFDALPGVLYFAVIVFFWFYFLGARYLGLVVMAAFVALVVFLRPMAREEFFVIVVSVLAVIAAGLLVATRIRRRQAFGFAALTVGAAVVALALRTLDLKVCSTIPFGTHFLWHIFLGTAAYAGVRMIVLLRRDPAGRVEGRAAGH